MKLVLPKFENRLFLPRHRLMTKASLNRNMINSGTNTPRKLKQIEDVRMKKKCARALNKNILISVGK